MPEDKKETKLKIDDIKGLLGWIQKEKVKSKESGKPWSWVMALIAAAVVFISLAMAAYQAWKKGREIAKLKHKIDMDEEAKKQAAVSAAVAKEKDKVKHAEIKASILESKIDIAKEEIRRLEEERKALNKKIDTITSWEDLDNF
jgi:cell division protein FtsL